jgi:hypothetical protein
MNPKPNKQIVDTTKSTIPSGFNKVEKDKPLNPEQLDNFTGRLVNISKGKLSPILVFENNVRAYCPASLEFIVDSPDEYVGRMLFFQYKGKSLSANNREFHDFDVYVK